MNISVPITIIGPRLDGAKLRERAIELLDNHAYLYDNEIINKRISVPGSIRTSYCELSAFYEAKLHQNMEETLAQVIALRESYLNQYVTYKGYIVPRGREAPKGLLIELIPYPESFREKISYASS